jgi:hypothetical protein
MLYSNQSFPIFYQVFRILADILIYRSLNRPDQPRAVGGYLAITFEFTLNLELLVVATARPNLMEVMP